MLYLLIFLLLECECIPLFFKKIQRPSFRWPFFLLSCYKVKICQKDTVENNLKIQVLLKAKIKPKEKRKNKKEKSKKS